MSPGGKGHFSSGDGDTLSSATLSDVDPGHEASKEEIEIALPPSLLVAC